MKHNSKLLTLYLFIVFSVVFSFTMCQKTEGIALQDPLPSWNDGAKKKSIIDFITKTTKEGSADFIPINDRVACFDNDGTLWCEQPMYFQMAFALDELKAQAPSHPEWKTTQPFKAALEGDLKTAFSGGAKSLLLIMAVTHSGMTTDDFKKSVEKWITTAKHPKTRQLYTDMIYQPMLELLRYLRKNGYKTFIVSGDGVDFMRVWAEKAYGIPSDHIVGSSGKVQYNVIDGKPVLTKLPELNFFDDKEGKPVGIYQYIGKRPVFTAGNSDGDYAMLQWTTTGSGPRFGMIIDHTDANREWNYRKSPMGNLEKGIEDAAKYNWVIVDMKADWKKIFPFEKQ